MHRKSSIPLSHFTLLVALWAPPGAPASPAPQEAEKKEAVTTPPAGAPASGGAPGTSPGPSSGAPPAPPPAAAQPGATGLELPRHLALDGQIRVRYEFFDPFAYTAAGVNQSDDAVFLRTRLGAVLDPHRQLSLRIQLQDSRIWGEEGAATATNPASSATSSIDNVDLHQAYVDLRHLVEEALGEGTLALRVGRQELSFGDQRLVSPLDWSNIARAWDAARLTIAPPGAPGKLKLDLFASIIRDTASSNAGGGPVGVSTVDAKQGFHGLYAAFEEIKPAPGWTWTDSSGKEVPVLGRHGLDLYVFYRDLADGVFTAENGTLGDVEELTPGVRLAGEVLRSSSGAGFDYTGEVAYQTGDFAGDDLRAYGYAVTGGYTFAGPALGQTKIRLGAEYDYGSGDSDPADGDRGTFDPLFPFGHYYQGIQDTFSWKNGQDLAFKLDLYPPRATRIPHAELQYHLFWLSEKRDGWFNAGLNQIRRDPTGSAGNFVGSEVDFTFKYAVIPPFAVLWTGYARFFPGEYVRDTGEDPDRDFIFSQLAVTF